MAECQRQAIGEEYAETKGMAMKQTIVHAENTHICCAGKLRKTEIGMDRAERNG